MSDAYLSNPNLKKIGVDIEFTQEQIEDYVKCAKDPIYFIRKFVKIVHVDHGLIPLDLYEYQERMIKTFSDNRFVITKMPRQSGKSTAVVGFILHYLLFNSDKNIAILANKAELARELLDRVKKAYENLPLWLQQGISVWNKGSIEVENGSKVFATSTTGSAARGQSFSLVFLDEFAFVQHGIADEFFKSVYPTISSGQETKMIIVSTPKGMNHFYRMWVEAEEGRSNFIPLAVNWWETPGRDEHWKEQQIANTSEESFEQEFACNFLGTSNTLIHTNALRNLAFVRPIFQKQGFDQYEDIKPGHEYVISVDTARGVGGDFSAFLVIDVSDIPYRVVAKYRDKDISPLIYPELIYNVANNFNQAFVLVEINDIGEQVANVLYRDLEYENLFTTAAMGRAGQRVGVWGGKNSQLGVRTTKQVKRIGCSTLKDLIEDQKIIIEDYDTIEELSNFVSKRESYEAEEGHHDDLVMCLVLFGWLIRQEYFKDLTNSDIRQKYLADREEIMDDEMLPFGFFDDGIEDERLSVEKVDHYSLEDLKDHPMWTRD
tara:strand:+ start:3356 stop:4993 length:1638 start_codon:yes stop_codon:yes gene_type:complete